MSDVLNGHLDVNPTTQVNQPIPPTKAGDATTPKDVCGVVLGAPTTYSAAAFIGWGQTQYLRFAHPRSTVDTVDWPFSVSRYGPGDAFSSFRLQVISSLDESFDITELQSSTGLGILDVLNPACSQPSATSAPAYSGGDLSGYVTIDVVNFCTNWFPSQDEFYSWDAIATSGWSQYGYTPNVLMGDVFYVDNRSGPVGNISGDPAVALEFDARLNWTGAAPGTFFGRFVAAKADAGEQTGGTVRATVPAAFRFGGDGREPLGDHYGFRYLANPTQQTRTWLLVWRGANYALSGVDLCFWLRHDGDTGDGFYDTNHRMTWVTYDEDENTFTQTQGGGPSGGQQTPPPDLYIFLEAQRIALTNDTVTAGNTQAIPGWGQPITSPPMLKPGNNWYGGWMDLLFRDATYGPTPGYNQAWVGVQHSGPGAVLSVGHAATNLNGNFNCNPPIQFSTVGTIN